jgi:hypothetical protein
LCRTNEKDGFVCCPIPIDQKINPYYSGLKGNWRANKAFAYTVDRDPKFDPGNTAKNGTNIRKGGVFGSFTSFYEIQSGIFTSQYHTDNKWIASSVVTRVNGKGQELENKDALNRYSSAQFGFNGMLSTAVAGNARSNELAYDGFEDYGFASTCTSLAGDTCREDGHFAFKKALRLAAGTGITLDGDVAHTGNYSIKVAAQNNNAYTIRKVCFSLADQPKYAFDGLNQMILKPGGVIDDFQPLIGKKYVVSGWIKGDVASSANPTDPSKAKISVEAFSPTTAVSYSVAAVRSGPKVEGWIRVMAEFEIPSSLGSVTDLSIVVRLVPGASAAWFDDVRVHPYDGNMKSFAYDYKTTRLMAELDENNYATFFEYNDEGQLLRNKKETEKGIATIRETRNYIRKNQ